MQTRDFCFWLQGLLEVGKIEALDAEQVSLIKAHLDLVFKHAVDIKTVEMEHPAANRVRLPGWESLRAQVGGQTGAPHPYERAIATC